MTYNINITHDVSIILSTYKSDDYINDYFNNIVDLINVANIQLIHVINEATDQELLCKNKFLNLQKIYGKKKFHYKYLVVPRESLYCSWNRAIKLSDSKFITISNVDDIRYPDGLRRQISFLKKSKNISLVSGQCDEKNLYGLRERRTINNLSLNNSSFYSGMYIGPFFMWTNPKYFGQKDIYFDEQFLVAGDFDFQIRFSAIGNISILDDYIGQYLNIGKGLSTGSIYQIIEGQMIYSRYFVRDKIIPLFSYLFFKKTYFPKKFKLDNKLIPIEEICQNVESIKDINSNRNLNFIGLFKSFFLLIKLIIKFFLIRKYFIKNNR